MAQLDYSLVADASKLVSEVQKAQDKIAALEGRLKQVGTASRTATHSGESMAQTFGKVGAMLGVGGGIVGGIMLFKSALAESDRYMKDIAQQASAANQSLVAFAQMQEKGTLGLRARQAAEVGARYGVAPGEAWATVQGLQAKLGTYEKGIQAGEQAFRLTALAAVPPEAARGSVSVGMAMGLTARQAGRAVYAAGKASELTPGELAVSAPTALPAWKDPVTAYGILAALSSVEREPSTLGTYGKQVGAMLQRQGGAVGGVWGRLGFAEPGKDPMAQLEALSREGLTTPGALQKAGFPEKSSMGLSILLRDMEATRTAVRRVRELYNQEDIIERERGITEEELPITRAERMMQGEKTRGEMERVTGAKGVAAMKRQFGESYLMREWEKRDISPFFLGVKQKEYQLATALGMSPETAVGMGLTSISGGMNPARFRREYEAYAAEQGNLPMPGGGRGAPSVGLAPDPRAAWTKGEEGRWVIPPEPATPRELTPRERAAAPVQQFIDAGMPMKVKIVSDDTRNSAGSRDEGDE